MAEVPEEERVYIREAAHLLDRKMATVRKWESLGVLPKHLLPKRDNRGWRYWSREQVSQINDWVQSTDRRPGKGLPYWKPTEKQVAEAMRKMRRPRKPTEEEVAQAMKEMTRPTRSSKIRKTTIAAVSFPIR